MSNQSESAVATLLVDPVNGGKSCKLGTIHDVPFDVLTSKCENAMVVLVDRKSRRVLMEVPNKLGWRLHFGCTVPDRVSRMSGSEVSCQEDLWMQAHEVATAAVADIGVAVVGKFREAGVMFFTFLSDHPPMRVRVFEAQLGEQRGEGVGTYYNFDEVPFERMWADDKIWMPTMLKSEESYFEAHFVFDGGPSAASRVVDHNYKCRDCSTQNP